MLYQNFTCMFFPFVTKHACDGQTDGRTERQNYDPQDRASIAASRSKNTTQHNSLPESFFVDLKLLHIEL